MQGRIIKGIAGFYYVDTGTGLYECKAKGIFRNRKMKPLVGDMAEIEVLDEEKKLGNLTELLPRTNELIRPAVSNIDQALVIFAAKNPKPNYNLLDRFLLMMEKQGVPAVVCFNKTDLAKEKELSVLMDVYKDCGHRVIFTSVSGETGLSEIREAVDHKTTVLAGPSGVGKSSMMNLLYPDANMETGAVSEKIQRGKHTTRHSELFAIGKDTYMMDTPGFSSMYLEELECGNLKDYFPEFAAYEDDCKFLGCVHVGEPVCGVKEAVRQGEISESRYDNYKLLYQELKDKRRY